MCEILDLGGSHVAKPETRPDSWISRLRNLQNRFSKTIVSFTVVLELRIMILFDCSAIPNRRLLRMVKNPLVDAIWL